MKLLIAGQSNAAGFKTGPIDFKFSHTFLNGELFTPTPDKWGPEVGFAIAFELSNPGQRLDIVEITKGETDFAFDPERLDWHPDSEGELWDQISLHTDADVLIWSLGETAALTDPTAFFEYQDDLFALFSNTAIVFNQLPQQHLPHAEAIRAYQEKLPGRMLNVDNFSLQEDGIHFTATDQLIFGIRSFFEVFQ